MDRSKIHELHYITASRNVPSITRVGILSHARAERVHHISVADADVQSRRTTRRIPGGLRLHQYANLYFNGRNAMLYIVTNNYDQTKRVPAEDLVVLRVSPSVLDIPGCIVTDINAAADIEPRWYSVQDGLAALNAEELYADSWNHRDPFEKMRRKQRMMAEVLVPHGVPVDHILGGYVVSDEAADRLSVASPTLAVTVKPYMFFRGGRP